MKKQINVGFDNYQVQKILAICGDYLPHYDPTVMRARGILKRCKDFNIKTDFKHPVELALYLKKITPKKCPVFNKPMFPGKGKPHRFSPSTDRIDPSKGYVRGNIQIISMYANYLKQEASKDQLLKFAHWVLGEKNATAN
jgi:hypothetical protein